MKNPIVYVAEQIDTVFSFAWRGLRSWMPWTGGFFPTGPRYDHTIVNMDLARQLYRNDGGDTQLGAGFCKPIIDRSVEFIGIPSVALENNEQSEEINQAVNQVWKPILQEMFRNSMRDSRTVVRIWRPTFDNPLVTDFEREACTLTIIDPDRCDLIYDPRDPETIIEAWIKNRVALPERDAPPRPAPGTKRRPGTREHEIWEVLRPNDIRYYDATDDKWLSDWAIEHNDGFVPLVEVFNEYDSTLSGGQSDLESVFPFVKAFHEVLLQGLRAHKYHSIPKAKFKVRDVIGFLRNNYPSTLDPQTGQPVPGSTISWEGREILFIGPDEDLEFIQMTSVLGDTKTLLEFLVDCIAVASEMPEELFMRAETGAAATSSSSAKIIAFEKKIARKRNNFQPFIQKLIKMKMVINGQAPERAELLWEEFRADELVTFSQALQQVTMSLEVMLQRQIVSDDTAREMIRHIFGRFFRRMKDPTQEALDAADNVDMLEKEADAQIKLAKAQPALPPSNGNGNRSGGASQSTSKAGGGRNE